jgi:hypothetical protein
MNGPHLLVSPGVGEFWYLGFLGFILVFFAPSVGKSRQLGGQYLNHLGHLGLNYLSSLSSLSQVSQFSSSQVYHASQAWRQRWSRCFRNTSFTSQTRKKNLNRLGRVCFKFNN